MDYFKSKMNRIKNELIGDAQPNIQDDNNEIVEQLLDNITNIKNKYQNSSDLLSRQITVGTRQISFVMIEGMVNLQTISEMLLEPILKHSFSQEDTKPEDIEKFIQNETIIALDMKDIYKYDELFQFIMSGFVVILIDGLKKGIVCGMQGFNFRSISEPASEINERGSREGFTEPLRINMTMVRRRIKSPTLKFEILNLGSKSKTDICLMYMTDKISDKVLSDIKDKLNKINLDIILTSGYIQPFLEGSPWSIFSDVGITERPDVLVGKINEGRVGIIVDGTPYSLIVPSLFIENFQSLDDYAHSSYYTSFMRIIKYFSFFATIFLPALYVAIGTFHPQLLPHSLLFNISAAEELTPFPLMIEALIIHFLYEIMREAGLRLPRPIGHAVSIVGALVIGDAAVTAGLIGAPMVLVVALTAISSFVVPSLYEPVAILRFVLIVVGGTTGLYGLVLSGLMILISICSLENFGIPYMSPIAPFSLSGMRDTFVRLPFKIMNKKSIKIENLNGVQKK